MGTNDAASVSQLKFLMIGDSGVGKTSIISMFADKAFTPNTISTIGVDFKQKRIDVDGRPYTLRIWDTAGQDQFKSITRQYYRGAHAIFVLYDSTSLQSFTHVTYWIRNIAQYASPHVPKILVANKVDDVAHRQVPTEAGVQFATALGIPYYECSATDYNSVEPIFMHMTKLVLSNLHNIAPGYMDAAAAPVVDIAQPVVANPSSGCKC